MARAGLPVLMLLASVAASGCADACQPMLEVRQCAPASDLCKPDADDPVRPWNATWAAAWPDVAYWMDRLPPGEHGHEDWTQERMEAWWAYAGHNHEEEKEAFFSHRDGMFRVRVLTC